MLCCGHQSVSRFSRKIVIEKSASVMYVFCGCFCVGWALSVRARNSTRRTISAFCLGILESRRPDEWGCSVGGDWRRGNGRCRRPASRRRSGHSRTASKRRTCGPPWPFGHRPAGTPPLPRHTSTWSRGAGSRNDLQRGGATATS